MDNSYNINICDNGDDGGFVLWMVVAVLVLVTMVTNEIARVQKEKECKKRMQKEKGCNFFAMMQKIKAIFFCQDAVPPPEEEEDDKPKKVNVDWLKVEVKIDGCPVFVFVFLCIHRTLTGSKLNSHICKI